MRARLFFVFLLVVFGLGAPAAQAPAENTIVPAAAGQGAPAAQEKEGVLSLDFKDVDIQNVLRILAEKGNVNIVFGKDVAGPVTIKLSDVSWQMALDVILKTYGYGYERGDNVITVSPLAKLAEQRKAQKELVEAEPVVTEVFVLKYVDANDAKKVIDPQLSGRGNASVLEAQGQKGWKFGAVTAGGVSTGTSTGGGKLERLAGGARSKTLVVSDTLTTMENVRKIITNIDVMPKQIAIETKIVEVSRDKLRDLGIDWGTGTTGAETTTVIPQQLSSKVAVGAHDLGDQVTPSSFNPKTSGLSTLNTGFKFLFQKLTGDKFEIILHALEEDVDANTLSNPRIVTLDNQEATILVGTKYPILETNVSGTDTTTTTTTLKYYQDIGIQLNVVPQISGGNLINMIVHPAVTSYTETLKARSSAGTILAEYPIINTREAETQILMNDGETVVIGGLLKDVKSKSQYTVPILGKIPILGLLFKRDTTDTEKIDLIIFITARIVEGPSGPG